MSIKNTLSQDSMSLNTYGLNYQVEIKSTWDGELMITSNFNLDLLYIYF